jgi:cytochrome c-type biogenesis protein CcmH
MTTMVLVSLLAIAAFAAAVMAFRLPRALWTSLAAALVFGLAGYATQARTDIPSAPRTAAAAPAPDAFDIVEQRREFIGDGERSRANLLYTADAMARRGRFIEASQLLSGITRENPRDFEAWLALGNALADHAQGALTPPALFAYGQAAGIAPEHPGPGYFIGVALIRQGRLIEARGIWADTLAAAPEGAAGRDALAERLARLDAMLEAMAAMQQAPPPPPAQGAAPPAPAE